MTATRKVGRPTKYDSINKDQLKKLLSMGLTDVQVCDFFNIAESTLNEYKNKYPEFSESLKDWKQEADLKVEKCLYQRALGYEFDEVTRENIVIDGKEVESAAKVKTIRKHYAPDVTAQIFWLKNRQPVQWREKQPEAEDNSLKEQELQFQAVPKGKLDDRFSRFLN